MSLDFSNYFFLPYPSTSLSFNGAFLISNCLLCILIEGPGNKIWWCLETSIRRTQMNGNTNYAQINKVERHSTLGVTEGVSQWILFQDELWKVPNCTYVEVRIHTRLVCLSLLLLHTLILNNLFSIIRAGWNTKLTNLCSTLEKSAWQREDSSCV